MCLVKLRVLAEMLLMPKLQNMVLDKLEAMSNKYDTLPGGTEFFDWVYENTGKASPLRGWLVFSYAFEVGRAIYTRHRYHFPQDMLYEMIVLFNTTWRGEYGRPDKNMKDYKVSEATGQVSNSVSIFTSFSWPLSNYS